MVREEIHDQRAQPETEHGHRDRDEGVVAEQDDRENARRRDLQHQQRQAEDEDQHIVAAGRLETHGGGSSAIPTPIAIVNRMSGAMKRPYRRTTTGLSTAAWLTI